MSSPGSQPRRLSKELPARERRATGGRGERGRRGEPAAGSGELGPGRGVPASGGPWLAPAAARSIAPLPGRAAAPTAGE